MRKVLLLLIPLALAGPPLPSQASREDEEEIEAPKPPPPKRKKPAKKGTSNLLKGRGFELHVPPGHAFLRQEPPPKEGDKVYFFRSVSGKKGPSLSRLGETPPSEYGKKGIILLEVVEIDPGEKVALPDLEAQVRVDLKGSGQKYEVTPVTVLPMPAFYVEVTKPEPYAQFTLMGGKNVYYVTAGTANPHVLSLVRSLSEGGTPKPAGAAAPKTVEQGSKAPQAVPGPANPFSGRRLQLDQDKKPVSIFPPKERK